MPRFKNFSVTTVATAPSPPTSGTSLVVADGTVFPDTPFMASIGPEPSSSDPFFTPANAEIVEVTNVATNTLTIVRAREGSAARTVVVGDVIAATVTAEMLDQMEMAADLFLWTIAR